MKLKRVVTSILDMDIEDALHMLRNARAERVKVFVPKKRKARKKKASTVRKRKPVDKLSVAKKLLAKMPEAQREALLLQLKEEK